MSIIKEILRREKINNRFKRFWGVFLVLVILGLVFFTVFLSNTDIANIIINKAKEIPGFMLLSGSLYEYYNVDDDKNVGFRNDAGDYGQIWKVGGVGANEDFTPDVVRAKVCKDAASSPGSGFVHLKNSYANGTVYGNTLCSGNFNANTFAECDPGVWTNFSISNCSSFTAGNYYAVIFGLYGGSPGNNFNWKVDDSFDVYAGGNMTKTTDDGLTWVMQPDTAMFEIWGDKYDTTAPNVTINTPLNQTYIGNSITFNVTAIDDVGVESCFYSLDGGTTKTLMSAVGSSYNATNGSIAQGGYSVNFYCNDTVGNENNSENVDFYMNSVPIIVVTSPTNKTYNTPTIYFNATADESISTWIINWNGTNVTHTINTPHEVEDGSFNLLFYGDDGTGIWGLNDTVDFSVDTTKPEIDVTYPSGDISYHVLNDNLTLNWTVTDTSLQACWYDYEGTNITVTCSDSMDNITIINYSNRNLIFYANDSVGNENSNTTSWNYNVFEYYKTFSDATLEGDTETFEINVSYNDVGFTNVKASLFYNGTSYTATPVGSGNNILFTKNLTIPSLSTKTNISFYWEIGVNNGTWILYNSSVNNQTVNVLAMDDCTTYKTILFNLSLKDERLQTKINGTHYNTSIEIDIDIFSVGSSSPIIEYSNNFSKNNNPLICLNGSLLDSNYEMDTIIKYGGDGYSEEFYNIQKFSLLNSSLPQLIDLYDLDDNNAQEFQITYKDGTFLPVEDALIQIQRFYTEEGDAKTVEIPKTDTNGECKASLDLNNVIYTIIVVKDGSTLATFDEVTPSCQTPSLSTCRIPLNSYLTHIEPEDFNSLDDFEFTLDYNNSNRVVRSVFSVPSASSSTVLLNVTMVDMLGNTSVCSDTLTSSSGTLSCTAPQNFGNGTLLTRVYKDGVLIGDAYFSMEQSSKDLYGGSIVFLTLFLFLTLIGIGVGDNAMITGFFMLIGVVLAISLNLVDSTGFIGTGATILWLGVAIVLVLIKGAKRE